MMIIRLIIDFHVDVSKYIILALVFSRFQHQYHIKSDEFLDKVQNQMMKSIIEKVVYYSDTTQDMDVLFLLLICFSFCVR